MSRRKTDGELIAQRMQENWAISGVHVEATEREIDRLIRKRMGEAWEDGWFGSTSGKKLDANPYRGRTKK